MVLSQIRDRLYVTREVGVGFGCELLSVTKGWAGLCACALEGEAASQVGKGATLDFWVPAPSTEPVRMVLSQIRDQLYVTRNASA